LQATKKGPAGPLTVAIKPGLTDFDILVQGFQALGANHYPNWPAVTKDRRPLQVRAELTFCFSLRKAHTMPKLWLFTAHFTYCHFHIAF